MSTRRDRAAGAILRAMNAEFDLGFDVDETAQLYRVTDFVLAEVDRVPDISELIEASSLGTPGAKAARASVTDEQAQRAIDRANEIEASSEACYCSHGLDGEDCALLDGHRSPFPRVGNDRWHVTPTGAAWHAEDDPGYDPAYDPQTDDGAVRSPATPRAVHDPAAQAEGTGWRPAPSSPTTDGGAAAPPGPSPQDAARSTAALPSVLPRPFLLFRIRDVSGTSGTGVVAWGCEFPDGSAALRWNGPHPSTAAWPSVDDIVAVHGHQGATVIHWLNGGA